MTLFLWSWKKIEIAAHNVPFEVFKRIKQRNRCGRMLIFLIFAGVSLPVWRYRSEWAAENASVENFCCVSRGFLKIFSASMQHKSGANKISMQFSWHDYKSINTACWFLPLGLKAICILLSLSLFFQPTHTHTHIFCSPPTDKCCSKSAGGIKSDFSAALLPTMRSSLYLLAFLYLRSRASGKTLNSDNDFNTHIHSLYVCVGMCV